MAMGIVSFALLSLVGLFGGVVGQAGANSERRALVESVDAMRGFLDGSGFTAAYGFARAGKELIYVTYRANDSDEPSTSGERILGRWMETNSPDLSTYEPARVGRWVKARIGVSPSNPSGTNNLPSDASSYSAGVLAVLVEMDAVPQPGQTLAKTPRVRTTIGITR